MRKIRIVVVIASMILLAALSTTVFAAGGSGGTQGFEIVPALFANQTTQNNGSGQSFRQMTTEMDLHVDAGYSWSHFWLGAVYDNGNVDAVNYAGANTENKTTLQWAGPSVGFFLGDLRLMAGWVIYASDAVNNYPASGSVTTFNYTSGSGPFGSISYAFHFGSRFFLCPTIDLYDITFTVGQTGSSGATALTRNYEITGVAPFLGFGFEL
jgi:hypothetical protein